MKISERSILWPDLLMVSCTRYYSKTVPEHSAEPLDGINLHIISCCCFCLYTTLLIILPFATALYTLLFTLHLNSQSCESIPLEKKVSIVYYPKRDTNCDLIAISVTDFNYTTIYSTSCTILEKKSHLCST